MEGIDELFVGLKLNCARDRVYIGVEPELGTSGEVRHSIGILPVFYVYQAGSDEKTNWSCVMNCWYLSRVLSKSIRSAILGAKVLRGGRAGVRV